MISDIQIDAALRLMFDDIEFPRTPAGLYDPLRYMMQIGGKRIRPRLCLLTYLLFKDTISDEILEPATALEVFHSFTLIHDDIMDNSPLRRGHETVWKKWDPDTAILSGDVMLIDAYKRMAKAPSAVVQRVFTLFSKTAAEVCEGQQYDMDFEKDVDVTMADYEKMIGLKTAVLIACSAEIGAIIAGVSELKTREIYRYGYELGMAFQIADDYLDAYGDEKIFGKPIGGDILNEKKSWLTIKAIEKCADKEAFLRVFCAPAETDEEKKNKIAAVKKIYDELGVGQDAREAIHRYGDRAMEAVSSLGLEPSKIESLKIFADKLVGRVK